MPEKSLGNPPKPQENQEEVSVRSQKEPEKAQEESKSPSPDDSLVLNESDIEALAPELMQIQTDLSLLKPSETSHQPVEARDRA